MISEIWTRTQIKMVRLIVEVSWVQLRVRSKREYAVWLPSQCVDVEHSIVNNEGMGLFWGLTGTQGSQASRLLY